MQNKKDPLIFIVEDNGVYNKLVVNYLNSKKFNRIKVFTSGESFLESIDEKPDIVIQDYLLEGMDGLKVLKTVKAKYPSTEFIFLSGQDSIEIALNTMKYGAFDYIVKDQMALKKLVHKINKILSMQQLVKNNKLYKKGVSVFFIVLILLVVTIVALTFIFPDRFRW